jgi:hypothetical protein
MANPEHLEILKQGVRVWNEWRVKKAEVEPDLSGADLSEHELTEFLGEAPVDDRTVRMFYEGINFIFTDLSEASLENSDLKYANLSKANLSECNLRGANLYGANLDYAQLTDTNLSNARIGWTAFGSTNLSTVKGLNALQHMGPSTIGLDTLYMSGRNIPEGFLRGCGVPEEFIHYFPSLIEAERSIQFYSCFISYASNDQDFAERLHDDLQAKGVRVWFAPNDLPIGARIRPAIDESIRVHDKLLLVLSETSVSSQWVEQEVETALAREREQEGKTVLFPVRLDDTVMEIKSGWPALLKNTRNVGDFTRWKDHDSYRKAFDRLLRDLKAEA